MAQANFWDNAESAQKVVSQLKILKATVEPVEKAIEQSEAEVEDGDPRASNGRDQAEEQDALDEFADPFSGDGAQEEEGEEDEEDEEDDGNGSVL